MLPSPCLRRAWLFIGFLLASSVSCCLFDDTNFSSLRISNACSLAELPLETLAPDGNLVLRGTSLSSSSLNAEFSVGSVAVHNALEIENLKLLGARFSNNPTLTPLFAEDASSVSLKDVVILTDCFSVSLLSNVVRSVQTADVSQGLGFMHIQNYSFGNTTYSNVNLTCDLPQIGKPEWNSSANNGFLVADGFALLNAVAAVQLLNLPTPIYIIYLVNNVSLNASFWQDTLPLTKNMTLGGDPFRQTVLDLGLLTLIMKIDVDKSVTFINIFCMNLSPLRGKSVSGAGSLPLFALSFWAIYYDFLLDYNPVVFINSTWLLPHSEYTYIQLLALYLTSDVPSIKELVANLKESFTSNELDAHQPAGAHILVWKVIKGNMLNGINLTMTDIPPTAFPWLLPDTDIPEFNFVISQWANRTRLGVYSAQDLLGVLQGIQDNPNTESVTIVLYANISLAEVANLWPVDGYEVMDDVVLIGIDSNNYTTLDMAMIPRFARIQNNAKLWFIYLDMVNMASNTVWEAGPLVSNGGVYLPTEVPTVEISFVQFNRSLGNLYFFYCTLVIPYDEFMRLHNAALDGRTALGSGQIRFAPLDDAVTDSNLGLLSLQVPSNASLRFLNLTYLTDVPLLYGPQVNSPLQNMALPPPLPGVAESDSSDGLGGGAIAGIVVGSVLGVAAACMFIVGWLYLKKSRQTKEPTDGSSATEGVNKTDAEHFKKLYPGGRKERGEVEDNEVYESGSSRSDPAQPQKLPQEELSMLMKNLETELDDVQLVLLDVLGRGGFGVVYKGVWKGLMVAVKTIVFQDKMFGDGKAQTTAILEAAISASLSHPNVVSTFTHDIKPLQVQNKSRRKERVDDSTGKATIEVTVGGPVVVSDWKLYIIQEFCDGGTLRRTTLRRKFWDENRLQPRLPFILGSALEIACGLAHLHSKNIIHGDLNLNNVLLKSDTSSDRQFVCKLADFGLSVKMGVGQSHISNMRRGTPFYTAPEVMEHGNMSKAADTFSFGVILWEMFHSLMSYRTSPEGQFSRRSIFPSFPLKCPPPFSDLAAACMDPDFKKRPALASVVESLQAMLELSRRGKFAYGAHCEADMQMNSLANHV